MENMRQN
jgi:hypothetical protein